MSNMTAERKSLLFRVSLILALALAFSGLALPASATPPDDLHFEIQVTYALGNFTTVNGAWNSGGLFASGGDAVQTADHAGWPGNGWQFQTSHFITTLSDGNGTLTIKDQSTQIDWLGFDSIGSGHWVIQHGTGAYAHLHGTGASTWQAIYHDSCPDPSAAGPCIILEMQLDGDGHVN